MTENYKALVAIDVDGTLLDSKHQVSKGAAEAITNLTVNGILPVLASGRTIDGVSPFYDTLNLGPYLIGAGGGLVSTTSGKIIKAFELSSDILPVIIGLAREIGVGIALHQLERMLFESSDELMKIVQRNLPGRLLQYDDLIPLLDQFPTVKVTLWGNHLKLCGAQQQIEALNIQVDMLFGGDEFLEITNPGVSKGFALTLLAQHLNIPGDRIAAIGDQYNDVSMFEVAPYAIAMGNAPDGVKSKAKFIAPSNDEGGLAWALENVVPKTWHK